MSVIAHAICHVAKSGLCSHNLSFCVHNEPRRYVCLHTNVCLANVHHQADKRDEVHKNDYNVGYIPFFG